MRIAFSGVPPARARDERSVAARQPERSPLRAECAIGCMSPSLCGAHASVYLAPDRELLPLRVELLEGLPDRGLGRGGLLLLRSPRVIVLGAVRRRLDDADEERPELRRLALQEPGHARPGDEVTLGLHVFPLLPGDHVLPRRRDAVLDEPVHARLPLPSLLVAPLG